MKNLITALPYFADPTQGAPISLGFVYIGIVDLDPTVLANRKEVTVVQENGTEVVIATSAQPLELGAGGLIMYNGSPVQVFTDGDYSQLVQDSGTGQKTLTPNSNSVVDIFPTRKFSLKYTSGASGSGLSGTSIETEFGITLAVGDLIETNYYTTSLTDVSGVLLEYTGVTTVGKDGNAPDTDGYFYDADGKQFKHASDIKSIRHWGATGDSVTDDITFIQACITGVEAEGGGAVFIPTGTYHITASMKVTLKTLSMYGEGAEASIISALSCNGLDFISASYDGGNSFIRDFAIVGESGSNPNFAAVASILPPGGVSGTDSRDGLHFEGMKFFDWNQAFVITDTWESSIVSCKFEKVNNIASVGDYAFEWRFYRNFCVFNGGDSHGGSANSYAIDTVGTITEGWDITGNQFFGFDRGLNIINGIQWICDKNNFSCEDYCVYTQTIQGTFRITNCYLEIRANDGVAVFGAGLGSDVPQMKGLVQGNTFISNSVSHTNTVGIQFNASGNTFNWHWTVADNMFVNFTFHDILSYNAGNLNILRNKCMSNVTTYSIYIVDVATDSPVFIEGNDCLKDIFASPSDITAGETIIGKNVISEAMTFGDIRSDTGDINAEVGKATAFDVSLRRMSVDGQTELTIDAAGAIAINRSYHSVDTFADAATDNLDTITNVDSKVTFLVLRAENGARTVNVRAGTGNIFLAGGASFAMDNTSDRLFLVSDGASWFEVSRSDNGG